METLIKINEIVPGLNGNDGLIREHFHAAKKRKERYYFSCLSQKKGSHAGKVVICYTRYTTKLMDWDNMCASFKHIGDALVKAGIIKDDKPSIVHYFVPSQIKCAKNEQKSVIFIRDYHE